VYLLGGLVTSRYVLFSLQDEHGDMKFASTGPYLRCGWPLLAGAFWPIAAITYVVAVVYKQFHPLMTWWYTKPSVRKAGRTA
jgi:hypothetical protein